MSDHNQTKCQQARELLSAFLDMELELSEVEFVEAHLEICPSCVNELAALERVVASVKSLPELPSRDFADDIEARIQAQALIEARAKVQQATLAPASDNVVPMVRPTKPRQKGFFLAAAAAVVLFGLVAQYSLHPQGPVEVAQAPTATFAKHQGDIITVQSDLKGNGASTSPSSDDIVALYDEESGNNGADVGISTNEDGLYAIKL